MSNTAKFKIKKEIMPNYFWHIMSLANVFSIDKSNYKSLYKDYYLPEMSYIYENREQFVWGNGITSVYSILLFFLPFRKELSEIEFFNYLLAIENSINGKTLAKYIKKIAKQFSHNNYNIISKENYQKVLAIFLNCFKVFQTLYKTEIEPSLSEVSTELEKRLDNDIFQKWEKQLDFKYQFNEFNIILTYANSVDSNLPNANNLSLTRNNFGISLNNLDYIIDLIYHEIGVFMLMPKITKFFSYNNKNIEIVEKHNLKYQAFESYIEYQKSKIGIGLNIWQTKMQNGLEMEMNWFIEYYRKNETKNIVKTLKNAVDSYIEERAI